MALCETGAVVGSVSGGCIEDDLIDRHTRAYAGRRQTVVWRTPYQRAAHLCEVRVTADEAHRFGLPCGGTLELLLEYDPDPQSLAEWSLQLESGQLVQRTVLLADGRVSLQAAAAPAELVVDARSSPTPSALNTNACCSSGAGQLAEYLPPWRCSAVLP